ncbi:MAG: DUF2393 domain-containing protein [Phycisphaerales bacterium]|nr:DUF2393 domain-containing protein [Phycisphaerales bacterium]
MLIVAVSLRAADKKKKPLEVEILEARAQRDERKVALDGRIRNSGERPIQGLVLIFDFFADGRQPLVTQKAPIDEETLSEGQEAVFRMELNAPPRAVEFRINAEDKSRRELDVLKAGPYPIE